MKYQIFLSSTYEDLKKERDSVSKAILELGHIPLGMEMFSAGDETQWQLIRREIDQSDYHVVIVAHRYGSMIDGISYTELEYDYAVKQSVPVLGFIISDDAYWPSAHKDTDPVIRQKLDSFKEKVKSKSYVFWNDAVHLTSKVLAALPKEIVRTPRPGWIRGYPPSYKSVGGQLLTGIHEIYASPDRCWNLLDRNLRVVIYGGPKAPPEFTSSIATVLKRQKALHHGVLFEVVLALPAIRPSIQLLPLVK